MRAQPSGGRSGPSSTRAAALAIVAAAGCWAAFEAHGSSSRASRSAQDHRSRAAHAELALSLATAELEVCCHQMPVARTAHVKSHKPWKTRAAVSCIIIIISQSPSLLC
jgi:hypothetical protein